jgi:hypothetical protein
MSWYVADQADETDLPYSPQAQACRSTSELLTQKPYGLTALNATEEIYDEDLQLQPQKAKLTTNLQEPFSQVLVSKDVIERKNNFAKLCACQDHSQPPLKSPI